jgi:hypothetical protein
MTQNLFIAFCLLALIAVSLYSRSQSSYAAFVAAGLSESPSETVSDESAGAAPSGEASDGETRTDTPGDAGGAPSGTDETRTGAGENASGEAAAPDPYAKTPEDITLDKRLDAQREKNERTYRESGITGSTFPTQETEQPRREIKDWLGIFKAVHAYAQERPDIFSVPAHYDDMPTHNTDDPRINKLLYGDLNGETNKGFLADFESRNLVAMELKTISGEWVILILGRDAAGGEWRVIFEGDVYGLRKEVENGN